MKKILFLFIVFGSGSASAQDAEQFFSTESRFFSNAYSPVTFSLGFQKYDKLQNSLTLYNPNSMLTSNYVTAGNNYLLTNNGTLSTTLNGIPVDSFNPNGTSNIPTALGMGVIRTLFKL